MKTYEINDYETQGIEFLQKYNIQFQYKYIKTALYFEDDKEGRDIYSITLRRKSPRSKQITIRFGMSLMDTRNNKEPRPYDLLACITKNDPGSFNEFCDVYGCSNDSIKALKTYKNVCSEWKKVNNFFSEQELEELAEIN